MALASRSALLCAGALVLLAGNAAADSGVPTYTYDVTASDSNYFFTNFGPSYNQVNWVVTGGTSNFPYVLDGPSGGSDRRRFQDYPGSVMTDNGYSTSANGKDAVWFSGGAYNDHLFTPVQPSDPPTHAFDWHTSIVTKGTGSYAGATGGTYSTTPRDAVFNPLYDSQGNVIGTDFSSGTSSGASAGYVSIPRSNGAPPPGRAYTLTQTYHVSGTEYGTFSQQAIAPAPSYQTAYVANFDPSKGPVSSTNLPFAVNSITRLVTDLGVQMFPRDVTSTVVTLQGPDGSLVSENTSYRNVAGLANFNPALAAEPITDFETTGYNEFITVFTGGTGKYAGARGAIFGWQQGIYEPGSLTPLTVTYWDGYISVAVPEPETYALTGIGLVLVASAAYRRRLSARA